MFECVTLGEMQRPESSRVIESQRAPRIEQQIEVVVFESRCIGRQYAKTARHPEMQDERRAAIEIDQQILRASTNADDRGTAYGVRYASRHGPTQPRFVYGEFDDTSPIDVRLDTAARGLNFGKLGHSPVNLNEKACTRAGLDDPRESHASRGPRAGGII